MNDREGNATAASEKNIEISHSERKGFTVAEWDGCAVEEK